MTTVFHRLGDYEIHDQIGSGGMAVVFLATDMRTNRRVALKLVSIEDDRDAQEVLEAERWGAQLQEEFCRESRYVPVVYEYGTQGQYFFIAMEHLDGRNLSEVISEGPLPPERAVRVASQLCEFLEAASVFERTLDGRTFNALLHGDLKPRNIRVLADDEIKVFDFGIAKALSLSRKVTRNDFGSTAYLSPERIESGNIEAQAEFWAVGVLLYEMLRGVQPFQAADTRRLEQRIRARQPPASLDGRCPIGLRAIIAKLLAGDVADRYASARAIREDLHRFIAGEQTQAQAEGWPTRTVDEPETRRTHRPAVDEEVTRRTARDEKDANATAATPAVPALETAVAAQPLASRLKKRRVRRFARKALLVLALAIVTNEIRVYGIAAALSENVPQDPDRLLRMWDQHEALNSGTLGLGIKPLERALRRESLLFSERTFARYRTVGTTVYEREWRQTRNVALLALNARPFNAQLKAALRYSDGHLRRIAAETQLRGKQAEPAQQDLTAAVTAFREAAELRPTWPDPFLGLMRTFIALEDIERGADALTQAQRLGYTAGNRDWAQLGEGYFARAAKLAEGEELEPLTRAAEAFTHAVDHFSRAGNFGNATQRLREAQRRLKQVQDRLAALSVPGLDRADDGTGQISREQAA
jgi:predicted Ser/Thr protein kinase